MWNYKRSGLNCSIIYQPVAMRLVKKVFSVLLVIFICSCSKYSFAQSDLKLWYNQPARNWNEALPIGNGRLGAMIFGGVKDELIQLNEATLWSGGPVNTNPN